MTPSLDCLSPANLDMPESSSAHKSGASAAPSNGSDSPPPKRPGSVADCVAGTKHSSPWEQPATTRLVDEQRAYDSIVAEAIKAIKAFKVLLRTAHGTHSPAKKHDWPFFLVLLTLRFGVEVMEEIDAAKKPSELPDDLKDYPSLIIGPFDNAIREARLWEAPPDPEKPICSEELSYSPSFS